EQLSTLHQITFNLLEKHNIDELLQTIVDHASRFLNAPYCEIMLLENEELVVKAFTQNQSDLAGDRAGRDEAVLSWKAFDTQLPATVDDYSTWPKRRSLYDNMDMGPVIVLPILLDHKSIGVLDVSRTKTGNPFDNSEIQAALLFSQLAALALDNAQLHETLRQESIRDTLTGLFNRRFMQETLTKEISQAERKSLPMTVVMFDLDHLKEINDTYGHSAGDEALRNLSLLLKTKVRTGDTACRYGGDEFTLILSDTKPDIAKQRMDELRMELKQKPIQHEGQLIKQLTISAGIAEYPQHGSTVQELIKAADTALYRAKQAGRDQVMVA
ncbi:MAG TPA: sensor domain-containing diguanylate cyclase, partial [Anaerolineales bacterium]|nr:sensor domain-containing diguanylate cyclase [Anaerolineales bacterium]